MTNPTDQPKLTAEERVKRLSNLKRINRECTNCDPGSICLPCTIIAIRQAEDAVREECAMKAYVEIKSRTLHDKDNATAEVVAQAIREGKP